MTRTTLTLAAAALLALAAGSAARADAQAAIDGCIDQLRAVGGPDAQNGGEVLSQSWSQAGTLVRLRDAGGTEWECIGYDDGAVGDLRVVDAMDDGEGAMDGAAVDYGPVVVAFAPGTSGAVYNGTLEAGGAIQYILNAREGQFLTVIVTPDAAAMDHDGAAIDYQIRNPDNSALLDMIDTITPYTGQLWQSGDHVVEIVNKESTPTPYIIEFSIE